MEGGWEGGRAVLKKKKKNFYAIHGTGFGPLPFFFFNKLALSFCGQQEQPGGLIDVQVPAERQN